MGVEVTVVGYAGPGDQPAPWPFVALDPPVFSVATKATEVLRLASARVSQDLARRAHLGALRHRAVARVLEEVDADVFVTHDYAALPMVAAAAARRGGRYAYDCREFYAGQHADSRVWGLVAPPAVRAVEGHYVRDAAWVTTVSDGLADLLVERYGLPDRPTVVRSTPALADVEAHEPGDVWTVLFHGHLRPDRNVHGLLESVPSWPDHLRLLLRGGGPPAYVQELREQVRELGAPDRVQLLPAVPWAEVVTSAATADIGVVPWPLDLPQKRISLPNKLFEYLMAGLAVIATGPSEVSGLVESYGAGRGYQPATPEALSAALHDIDREALLAMRAGAAVARQALTWEQESLVLRRLWERTLAD
jgi:glycosyltransferase involved in cell wall biosynthesis